MLVMAVGSFGVKLIVPRRQARVRKPRPDLFSECCRNALPEGAWRHTFSLPHGRRSPMRTPL